MTGLEATEGAIAWQYAWSPQANLPSALDVHVSWDVAVCDAPRGLSLGPVTGFVHYAPRLLLAAGSPQDVRGSNSAIKVYGRKSVGAHPDVAHRDAPRLMMVSHIMFGTVTLAMC